MEVADEYLEKLRSEERTLRLRLASVQAAIDVYIKGEIGGGSPSGGPSLDSMRIRDAIAAYLGWRQAAGMPVATLGDLEQELAKHHVVNSRNEPMSATKHPWKSMAHTLAAQENEHLWEIQRTDPEGHFSRRDKISFRPKAKKP
jgi:hypothetical protein